MENRYKFNSEEHIHLLDGKPLVGTSTLCKIISKPLTWWASGMAVAKLGWINSKLMVNGKYKTTPMAERIKAASPIFEKVKKMTIEEYIKLLDEGYGAHNARLKEAASDGTDMHAELEKYVKACIATNGGEPLAVPADIHEAVAAFAGWANENVEKFIFSEAHCYSERLWVGGIVDAGAILKDGAHIVIDFKSAKAAYFDHFIQTSLYHIQIAENGTFDADGNQVLPPMEFDRYMVVPFGTMPLVPKERFDVKEFKAAAEGAAVLYKHSLKYEN